VATKGTFKQPWRHLLKTNKRTSQISLLPLRRVIDQVRFEDEIEDALQYEKRQMLKFTIVFETVEFFVCMMSMAK
jgi:hypothetical protein